MSVTSIQRALSEAQTKGPITPEVVDRIMLDARGDGGLDVREAAVVLHAADGFDDAAKQRVLTHLSAMRQKNAWVNVEAGKPATIEGQWASLTTSVPGLSAKEGLFDSCFSLKGTATEAGALALTIAGKRIVVQVEKGDPAGKVLDAVKSQLPSNVTGLELAGDTSDPSLYSGVAAKASDTVAHLVLYKPQALGLLPNEKPLRVVVTGYGAFMGITDNPSATMAQKLATAGVKGAVVEYRRLDVTPGAVDAFIAEMKKDPPDVILSMGVGGKAQVEELPENHLGSGTDGNNQPMTDREVRPGGPAELKTDLPVDRIDWALKPFGDQRAVGTSLSDPNYTPDRSAYLCNYLGYNLAAEFGPSPSTTAGFMHVTESTPPDQMHAVLEALVARQRQWLRSQTVPVPTS